MLRGCKSDSSFGKLLPQGLGPGKVLWWEHALNSESFHLLHLFLVALFFVCLEV
jgi:hypothetical protein